MGFPVAEHDHDACVRGALAEAEAWCRRSGARLTPIRRRVLELVWHEHRPVGAYALLETLGQEGWSAAPPTVYRALDFLLEQGLVHRINRLNAYLGCCRPGTVHGGAFLLCAACGAAAELMDTDLDMAIRRAAEAQGFAVQGQSIEVEGLCPACRKARGEAP